MLSHTVRPWIIKFEPAALLGAFPVAILATIPFGPLPEELGWRGYALPKLEERFSPLGASIVLGLVWTFWHAPQMLWLPGASFPSVFHLTPAIVLLYAVYTVSETVIMTYLFHRTRGSVLLAIAYHVVANGWENGLLPAFGEPTGYAARTFYYATVAALAAVALACALRLRGAGSLSGRRI